MRTCCPRALDLVPVGRQTGEAFRRLEIVPATLKDPLFLSTARWEPRNVAPTLHPLHAPDCPIKSQSGTSCSELELTDWPGNAVRLQRTRRCEEREREKARWRGRTADWQGATGAGRREGATWRCHGNTERGEAGPTSSLAGFRARCRLRRCWS